MNIDLELLRAKGAFIKTFEKNEIIFYENESANYYYQIIEGQLKLFNVSFEGKQFAQGIFSNGNSFGEPPLMIHENYPCSAITMIKTRIIKLPKASFNELLKENNELQLKLIALLARRVYNKSITAKEIINNNPASRIEAFLKAYKKKNNFDEKSIIPLTRQMIADLTGLRVETVIRTLKKMELENIIQFVNKKIIF